MRELQEKQKRKRRLYSLPVLIFLTLLLLVFVRGAWGAFSKERESERYLRDLESRADTLSAREKKLEGDIARLKTEEGIDEEIKEKFSVSREGEYVAVIVDDKSSSTTPEEERESWFRKLWNAIIGR